VSALSRERRKFAGSGRQPRIAFLGMGWIGTGRMRALLATGWAHCCGVADLDPEAAERGASVANASAYGSLDELLDLAPDGIVIATPSALHAEQAINALERGIAVFCQKPLARDAAETRLVLEAAREADRLLDVDLSYRHTAAATALRDVVRSGRIGKVYAVELVFHNAYGPDKPWFTRRSLSGGGCLLDLGTHLLDLALWLTSPGVPEAQAATLLHRGEPISDLPDDVEDFAIAQLRTGSGVWIRLACSWFQPAGRDCALECTFYGKRAAVAMRNLDGSFYDFTTELRERTAVQTLTAPPDDWGGRGITAWAQRLASNPRHDSARGHELERLAETIDAIYARGWHRGRGGSR
jgi:predicted dehydrogenase